jgi:hypothetical protein
MRIGNMGQRKDSPVGRVSGYFSIIKRYRNHRHLRLEIL